MPTPTEKQEIALIRRISSFPNSNIERLRLNYNYRQEQDQAYYDVLNWKKLCYNNLMANEGYIYIQEPLCKTDDNVTFIIRFSDVYAYIKLHNFENRFECSHFTKRETGYCSGIHFKIHICDLTLIE